MSDFLAYDANLGEMVDLRECSDAELRAWLEASEQHGDEVVARDCHTLLAERGLEDARE